MSTTGSQVAVEASFGEGLQLVDPPRGVPAGNGMSWIGAGWKLFTKAWLMWIVSILVVFVLAIVISLVPFIGSIVFQILTPVFTAGFIVACRSLEKGGEFEIEHLFAGFKVNFVPLMLVGLLYLVGWIAIFLIAAVFVGFGVIGSFMTGNSSDMTSALMGSGMSMVLGGLVILALMVPLLMFYWFAPALVIMHNTPPVAAMTASFRGCLRNIVPFLLYGIVMSVLGILAAIPFGLGLLAWVPLAITSTYAAYRDIYTDPPPA